MYGFIGIALFFTIVSYLVCIPNVPVPQLYYSEECFPRLSRGQTSILSSQLWYYTWVPTGLLPGAHMI